MPCSSRRDAALRNSQHSLEGPSAATESAACTTSWMVSRSAGSGRAQGTVCISEWVSGTHTANLAGQTTRGSTGEVLATEVWLISSAQLCFQEQTEGPKVPGDDTDRAWPGQLLSPSLALPLNPPTALLSELSMVLITPEESLK